MRNFTKALLNKMLQLVMKNILLLFLFIGIYTSAQAQTYFPFTQHNAVMTNRFTTFIVPAGSPVVDNYGILYCNGDTLLGGKTYKKQYLSNVVTGGSTIGITGFNTPTLLRFYRDDATARQVLYRNISASDTAEYVLYDFNLPVGSVVNYFNFIHNYKKVAGYDSVLIGSNYHRTQLIVDSFNTPIDTLIEGLGPFGVRMSFEHKSGVCCYNDGSNGLLSDALDNFSCISIDQLQGIINTIDEKQAKGEELLLWSNLVSESISLRSIETTSKSTIRIFSNMGANIMELPFTNELIDICALASGLYVLQLETSNHIYTQKFLKQ
jgi:hypothetical protein